MRRFLLSVVLLVLAASPALALTSVFQVPAGGSVVQLGIDDPNRLTFSAQVTSAAGTGAVCSQVDPSVQSSTFNLNTTSLTLSLVKNGLWCRSLNGADVTLTYTIAAIPTGMSSNVVYASTAAPSATNDSASGYTLGAIWIRTTTGKIYIAVDVSVGAASWALIN